ncbi:MAG: DoxX family protein [Gemmatimonadetes bacterium]|nr:DoxX family protein [Gemmatimonadota bacterium]MBT5145326.1 DoxX family protein [Gemmatimonadota bacterium]MBT5591514.1 DoxX family protein [Gemmatimonadota bacterium]MBT6631078.1 DoxX family protein [Gemmatimonadota bacterium]MBT7452968.1 DoxX family protein [Gemmatimonadota bacterium]
MTETGSALERFCRWGWRWKTHPNPCSRDIGLFLLRITCGGTMAIQHGFGKLTSYSERAATWADPIGVGSELSLALAILAEFFCSIFVVHSDDPFRDKELAFLYLACFTTLAMTGAGRYSIDGWLNARRTQDRETN